MTSLFSTDTLRGSPPSGSPGMESLVRRKPANSRARKVTRREVHSTCCQPPTTPREGQVNNPSRVQHHLSPTRRLSLTNIYPCWSRTWLIITYKVFTQMTGILTRSPTKMLNTGRGLLTSSTTIKLKVTQLWRTIFIYWLLTKVLTAKILSPVTSLSLPTAPRFSVQETVSFTKLSRWSTSVQ